MSAEASKPENHTIVNENRLKQHWEQASDMIYKFDIYKDSRKKKRRLPTMDNFLLKIQKQLKKMTEQEKDAWVLSQAKILPEWEQEDFYKSICGTKKIFSWLP